MGVKSEPQKLKGEVNAYDGEEARREGGDEVLARACAHDGVVRARHGRAVVRRHHQTHLDELARVRREPAKNTDKS